MNNIRIVSQNGKYKLYYVLLDEDGFVDRIYDEVEVRAEDSHAMLSLLDSIENAKKYPSIIVNAANKKDLFGALDD